VDDNEFVPCSEFGVPPENQVCIAVLAVTPFVFCRNSHIVTHTYPARKINIAVKTIVFSLGTLVFGELEKQLDALLGDFDHTLCPPALSTTPALCSFFCAHNKKIKQSLLFMLLYDFLLFCPVFSVCSFIIKKKPGRKIPIDLFENHQSETALYNTMFPWSELFFVQLIFWSAVLVGTLHSTLHI